MSSRTTAHTPTTDTMIGASLGELEIVGNTAITDDDKNGD